MPKSRPKQRSRVVSTPAARTMVVRNGQPNISTRGAVTIIRHREYVGTVSGHATVPVIVSHKIQPGFFTWLGPIAALFESYKFTKLDYIYGPAVGTTTAGLISMGYDFDALDVAPDTIEDLFSYAGSVTQPVWKEARASASTSNANKMVKERYTRTSIIAGSDLKTYDVGNFVVASVGYTGVVGRLFVEYVIELRTPQIQHPSEKVLDAYILESSSSVAVPITTGAPRHGELVTDVGVLDTSKAILYILPNQDILATVRCTGSSIVDGNPLTSTGTGITATKIYSIIDSAGTHMDVIYRITNLITGLRSLYLTYTSLAATITSCSFTASTFDIAL